MPKKQKKLPSSKIPKDELYLSSWRDEVAYCVCDFEATIEDWLPKNECSLILTLPFAHADGKLTCPEGSNIIEELQTTIARVMREQPHRVYVLSGLNPHALSWDDSLDHQLFVPCEDTIKFLCVEKIFGEDTFMQYGLFLVSSKDGEHTLNRAWIPSDPTKPPSTKVIKYITRGT